jgi:methanogenic corrinoid protein MtbC1
MEERAGAFSEALLTLNRLEARRIVAGAGSLTPLEIAERVIVPALEGIGAGWQRGDIALSQVYMSGRICEELMDELLPPGDTRRHSQPVMAIATLEDYHLLGKRLVYSVLRAGGFAVQDYGRLTVDEALARVAADRVRLLLVSTLMLPSALQVRELVRRLKATGRDVKVIVGGAPFLFDDQLWQEVQADAMGRSASEAVPLVEAIMRGQG